MESLKTPSRITTLAVTIIFGIITYISTMNPSDLANQLGVYGSYASIIIVICASIVKQYSEEKRVTRAEQIIENNYTKLGYPKTQKEDNKEPTIKIEVDADKVLSEIEKRKQELNTPPTVDDIDQALTEIQEEDSTQEDVDTLTDSDYQ